MRSLLGEVRSIRRKVLCMFKTWNGLHRKKAPAGMRFVRDSCVPCLVLVQFASVDVWWTWFTAGHYLTCNGSTGNVPDTRCMFSGRLLTRNAWKLTNNDCKTVIYGTKLMTHLAKLPTTSIWNCDNLIITNYLITIFICKPFQKFYFKLP